MKPKMKCHLCGKSGYPKNCYYELIGYPEHWDNTRGSRNNKTQIEARGEPKASTSALITTTGNEGKMLNTSISDKNTT